MTRRHLPPAGGWAGGDARPLPGIGRRRYPTFSAPADRVWTVARSTLESPGWKIDKEDRDVGWVPTKSRGVDHDDYGVYAKGTRHRLRVMVRARGRQDRGTVERRL